MPLLLPHGVSNSIHSIRQLLRGHRYIERHRDLLCTLMDEMLEVAVSQDAVREQEGRGVRCIGAGV